ncbi:serine/arginine repetitive matrix protein 2 isoform X8 [Phacochoerus africanus]|uniref:serine/arginine repetitive matrix protein 2 isoform X8 n=1 Tax=Phacochoerus africanus TaxID=41426 RepID=UPI001FDA7A2A|nr:serine/arginine repetitive matrix protein 2 isoform X8 [Phacochoerus africanus]
MEVGLRLVPCGMRFGGQDLGGVVLSAGWWVWESVALWGPPLTPRSRSPRKPIDSLRDSRSLSYSPAERRRPSPHTVPWDQQSSERGSRKGQRGDSRSPGHKRRKETPSPRSARHRSSRSP